MRVFPKKEERERANEKEKTVLQGVPFFRETDSGDVQRSEYK